MEGVEGEEEERQVGENHLLLKKTDSSLVWNEDKDLPDAKQMKRISLLFSKQLSNLLSNIISSCLRNS